MPCNSNNPDYDKIKHKWDLVRSIVNNDAQKWIRTVDLNDLYRSKQYKSDAILTNYTRLTKVGLTGLVFRKPAKIEIAPGLEYVLEDATGYGFGLEQFTQQIIGEILMTGRHGLLIDCPPRDPDGLLNDSDDYTRFRPYAAESIINWRYEEFGSEYKPVLIVLKEDLKVYTDDPFVPVMEPQYRVLLINPQGEYQQTVYNKDCEIIDEIFPTDYHGNPLTEIPFVFIGAENNDSTMDNIPLYDLAVVNLGHYRNSADLEESIFIVGQPFLVVNVGETSQEEFKLANPNGLQFGARGGLILSAGGDAHLLQANPNQMVSVEMTSKVTQMAGIGARIVQAAVGRETAEAARIRYGAQNSALYVLTSNVSSAIEAGLFYLAQFQLETPVESSFNLNDQFYDDFADATIIAQNIMMFDRGIMSLEEVRDYNKNVGILPPDPTNEGPGIINPLAGSDKVRADGVVIDPNINGRDVSTGVIPNDLAYNVS